MSGRYRIAFLHNEVTMSKLSQLDSQVPNNPLHEPIKLDWLDSLYITRQKENLERVLVLTSTQLTQSVYRQSLMLM